MRLMRLVALVTLMTAAMAIVAPPKAEALFRLGVEARWAPLSDETMTDDGEQFAVDRHPGSTGLGVRGLLGFDYFAIGGKLNFTHHIFESGTPNYTQIDVNGHARWLIPRTRLAAFAEGGASMSLSIGGVGFNVGTGLEVDVLGWPHVDMNLGLAAQYVDLPVGIGPGISSDNEGFRGLITLGFDFSLHDADRD